MADAETIKSIFERNARAVELRPSLGQRTAVTTIRLHDGTTCEVENGKWKFTVDVGTDSGGNDAGPGPGVLERAALGSCLAIGYSTWAAVLGVTFDRLEVSVESDYDARGQFGVGDVTPGFSAIRYSVTVESSASEEEIIRVLDKADAHSPGLYDFKRPIPIERHVHVISSVGA